MDKGYDNFLVCAYPPILMDLPDKLSFLNGFVEVVNNVDDINIADGTIKVDWNMFILGVKRIHLGTTIHSNISEIDRGTVYVDNFSGPIPINKLVDMMVDFLGESKLVDTVHDKSKLNTRPTIFNKPNNNAVNTVYKRRSY